MTAGIREALNVSGRSGCRACCGGDGSGAGAADDFRSRSQRWSNDLFSVVKTSRDASKALIVTFNALTGVSLQSHISSDRLPAHFVNTMPIDRLLISAGAMKAGTSWLFKMLEQHPFIETTPIKEIHYLAHIHTPITFLDDAGRLHNFKTYARDCEQNRSIDENSRHLTFFANYLASPINDRWFFNLFKSEAWCYKAEFSNMICLLEGSALRHLRRLATHVRLIYTVRDPLSRLWSHVKFHAAIMGDSERLNSFSVSDFDAYINASGAAVQSDYAANIARMRRVFSPEELRILYFEDFATRPQHVLHEICDFLDIPPQTVGEIELRSIHNPGPIQTCPPNFLRSAERCIAPQFEALNSLGVTSHSQWITDRERWNAFATAA